MIHKNKSLVVQSVSVDNSYINNKGLIMKYKEYLSPEEPSYFGLDFDLKTLKGELLWLENKMNSINKDSKEYRDLTRQCNEKVWRILLLELNHNS